MNTYNSSNPFKVPSCFQRADVQQRRRDRIKKVVIGLITAFVTLLVVLLIEGCMTEHARASITASTAVAAASDTTPYTAVVAESKPLAALQANPVVSLAGAPAAVKIIPPSADRNSGSVYVVKAGDTLARIAKQHRLTVKAIKFINDLDGDSIVVGMRLKLPVA